MEQISFNDNILKVSKSFNSSQLEDIISNNVKENESNDNNIKNRSNHYLLENDEILPYSPEMLEDLLKTDSKVSENNNKNNTSAIKQNNEKKIKDNENVNNILSNEENKDNIKKNNIREKNQKEDNILSLEELNKKRKKKENTLSSDNKENKPKKINKIVSKNKKEKENVINFEDLLAKRAEKSLSKSKDKSKDNELSTDKKKKKNHIKIDFNGRLYQQKKNYQKIKEEEEKQGNEINDLNNIKKFSTKSQKKPYKKNKIFNEENKKNDNFQSAVGFEYFMNKKGKENLENKPNKSNDNINKNRMKSTNNSIENKNKENNKEKSVKKYNKNNAKIINDFLNRNVPKKKEKEEIKKGKDNSSQIKQIRKNKQINKSNNRKENSENMVDFKIFKKENSERAFNLNNSKERLYNNNNNNLNSKSKRKESANKNKLNNIRKIRRVNDEDRGVPLGVTEAEINLAMKNKDFSKNFQKRFSPIKDNLINFDNSKFAKYDTEQVRYGLIKDYVNIRPNKDDKFLQRMQFESLKRKNQAEKINELVEKSKHKVDEAELKETFNRLVDDANRRFIEKQGINDIGKEKEKEQDKDMIFKNLEMTNQKKYNEEEWEEIYNKRFRDYDEYKKKRLEIKREKEKIEKMIEEEEQLKLCRLKKIPISKIRENTQRLYDEAKKREAIKKRKIIEPKSAKNYSENKDNTFFNSFNDEEDASKYMKNYKSETYNFLGNNINNNLNYDYNNYNNMYFNFQNNYKPKHMLNNNQIYNGGNYSKLFYRNNLNQKFNNRFITEPNNRTVNHSKNNERIRKKLINYPFSENKKYINNNTFDNKYKDFPKYNDFKINRLHKGVKIIRMNIDKNNSLKSPYGYYNYINNKLNNNNNQYNNGANCRENIVDKYLYDYCFNRYYNQNYLN